MQEICISEVAHSHDPWVEWTCNIEDISHLFSVLISFSESTKNDKICIHKEQLCQWSFSHKRYNLKREGWQIATVILQHQRWACNSVSLKLQHWVGLFISLVHKRRAEVSSALFGGSNRWQPAITPAYASMDNARLFWYGLGEKSDLEPKIPGLPSWCSDRLFYRSFTRVSTGSMMTTCVCWLILKKNNLFNDFSM